MSRGFVSPFANTYLSIERLVKMTCEPKVYEQNLLGAKPIARSSISVVV